MDNVNEVSKEYKEYMDILAPLHALLGGTRKMRKERTKYLPMMMEEKQASYNNRLGRSVLFNGFKRTVQKLTGEVFSKEIVMDEGMNPIIKDWLENNIDMEGKSLDRFAWDVFYWGIIDGVTYILVDYDNVDIVYNEQGNPLYFDDEINDYKVLTEEVEKEKGWRARWIHLKASDIIGGIVETINGKKVLTQIRIREYSDEKDGLYGTKTVEKIRVLGIGTWELWKNIADVTVTETKSAFALNEDWILEDSGVTNLNYIPLAICMFGDKRTELTAEPPLEGCAYLNIAHWQSSSDQRNILHFSRFVVWFGKMLNTDDNNNVVFGPNRLVNSNNPDADLKAVEMSGAAINAGRQDLQDLERNMSLFGLNLMLPKTGTITATEKAIDTSENQSVLKGWAVTFNDFLNTCITYTAQMIGVDPDTAGTVTVNKEFRSYLTDESARLLLEAFIGGLLPVDILIEEFKRRGILSAGVDTMEVAAIIQKNIDKLDKKQEVKMDNRLKQDAVIEEEV